MGATERNFEALNYDKDRKAFLTAKQYLVYSYLMSISKWDAQTQEDHYYVYKNSFKIKDACEFLKISQPTWRSAIQKLKDFQYISEFDKYYKIYIPNSYAPLDIELIRLLLAYGTTIQYGGIIVSLYSVLYKHWYNQRRQKNTCHVNVTQLRKLFIQRKNEENMLPFKTMLSLFETLGLIDLEKQVVMSIGGKRIEYMIKNVRLTLPPEAAIPDAEDDDISELIEALQISIKKEEEQLG